ncbi:MAG TPA: choice-of-anchor Q domain-containing protein [Rudaea sp.]
MRKLLLVFLLLLGSFVQPAAASSIVRIPDGDCAALSHAVNSATGPTTILLARSGHYAGCGIAMDAAGNITIDGQGAHIQFFSACLGNPYPAAYSAPALLDADLTIRNVTIGAPASVSGTTCYDGGYLGTFGAFPTSVGIYNLARLTLDTVTLQDLVPPMAFYDGYIKNGGSLTLRNVTVANVSQEIVPGSGSGAAAIINNFGQIEIYNSTFSNNSATFDGRYVPLIDSETWVPERAATVRIANSLLAGNKGQVCGSILGSQAEVTSLGGNVSSDSSCGFSAATHDLIVQDAGLGTFGENGGLVPTQALAMTSPARGVGNPAYCEAVDARGQSRIPNRCDTGAYEFGGGQAQLSQGGMNGVFYNRAYNGHYVSIERLDTGSALVFWNTFDRLGSPAWVYGVATVSGTHLHADATENLGAVLQPGSAPLGYHAQPWGSIDIDLTDCNNGTFAYHTTLPQFGSGQFALNRLTNVGDLQCTD